MLNLPSSKMEFTPKKIFTTKGFFVVIAAGIILINACELSQSLIKIIAERNRSLFRFSGLKFSGLDGILQDAAYVGYYTDKNLSKDRDAAAQFSQAQYILAPAILDVNNTNHFFTLFDCTTEEMAFKKIKELGAIPIKKNKFGIILATHKEQE